MGKLFEENLPFNNDIDDAIDAVDPAKDDDKPYQTSSGIGNRWSTPTYTSPWDGPTQQVTNNVNNNPLSPFSNNNTVPRTNPGTPSFFQPSFYNSNNPTRKNNILPRSKKIIFCDFLDNIVENYQGCPGVEPRGIYDLRPKFDFWHKMKYINPDYVIVCTNQNFTTGTKQSEIFKTMVNYYMNALAEFIHVPYENCFFLCKTGFNKKDPRVKPNPGMVLDALRIINWKEQGYKKSDVLIVGYNSGFSGQSDIDYRMAKSLGIDYIDVPQLIDNYV